ncbi:MAG: hypothetical protein IJ176_02840 [Prevotella sp.]|nr:hypothetical protein [Prevotella sp.]
MNTDYRLPTEHSMKRRSDAHDYSRKGVYHITISASEALRQPFGRIAGRLDRPDGDSDAPHVELTPVGRMVAEELTGSIRQYYPMLEVIDFVVMPEHLHFLLQAHGDVVSQNGKATHLGHVIAGFKYGCNKRFWAMTGRADLATKSPGTLTSPAAPSSGAAVPSGAVVPPSCPAAAGSVLGDSVAKKGAAEKEKLPPLFEKGYCDVMPVDAAQLATQRAYIRANPRSRLLRMTNRQWLQPQRLTVDTAVSLPALHGYLQRECPRQLTAEQFSSISSRLLQAGGHVQCDCYGNLELLRRPLLPVVCHRADAALFPNQKSRCLTAAASGSVLVSARISPSEKEIVDAALLSGFPVVLIEANGFPALFHPSADRMDDCAAGRLLLLAPWSYQFRNHDESVSVPFCKTMNCIVQAVCRQKDTWWKN